MNASAPHFLLVSEAVGQTARTASKTDRWKFVLQSVDDDRYLVAADHEPQASGERLELMAVLRGLEALDQPSRVTLVTRNRYIRSGFTHGLDEWRESGWRWERFGRLVPVKNRDLWQRINRTLNYHEVECRTMRLDRAHGSGSRGSQEAPDSSTGRSPASPDKRQKADKPATPLPTDPVEQSRQPARPIGLRADRPTSAAGPTAAFRRHLSKLAQARKLKLTQCVGALLLVGWLT